LFLKVDILTAVKEAIQSYWGKVYSRSSFNDMWILKCCKDVLDNLNSFCFRKFRLSKHVTFPHDTNHYNVGMYTDA